MKITKDAGHAAALREAKRDQHMTTAVLLLWAAVGGVLIGLYFYGDRLLQ
jgi:hypothetical protein